MLCDLTLRLFCCICFDYTVHADLECTLSFCSIGVPKDDGKSETFLKNDDLTL